MLFKVFIANLLWFIGLASIGYASGIPLIFQIAALLAFAVGLIISNFANVAAMQIDLLSEIHHSTKKEEETL